MTAPRNLKTIAGCPTRILVSITAPEGTDTSLTAYVNNAGNPIPAQIPNPNPNPNPPEPAEILFPPLPAGEHLYEIRLAGKPIAWGHLLARQTAYPPNPADIVDWELTADLTATDAAQISLELLPGARGLTGESAYHAAVQGGFEGTEEEFAAMLAGLPQDAANAAESARDAAASQAAAAASETAAAASATAAGNSATAAANSATAASTQATEAATSATTAATKASDAANSANAAAGSATEAGISAASAGASAQDAADDAADASTAAATATAQAALATTQAGNAAASATTASQQATAAANSASAAAGSATTAGTKAAEAAGSANAAATKATEAANSANAAAQSAEDAQEAAELLGDAALQGSNNTFTQTNTFNGDVIIGHGPEGVKARCSFGDVNATALKLAGSLSDGIHPPLELPADQSRTRDSLINEINTYGAYMEIVASANGTNSIYLEAAQPGAAQNSIVYTRTGCFSTATNGSAQTTNQGSNRAGSDTGQSTEYQLLENGYPVASRQTNNVYEGVQSFNNAVAFNGDAYFGEAVHIGADTLTSGAISLCMHFLLRNITTLDYGNTIGLLTATGPIDLSECMWLVNAQFPKLTTIDEPFKGWNGNITLNASFDTVTSAGRIFYNATGDINLPNATFSKLNTTGLNSLFGIDRGTLSMPKFKGNSFTSAFALFEDSAGGNQHYGNYNLPLLELANATIADELFLSAGGAIYAPVLALPKATTINSFCRQPGRISRDLDFPSLVCPVATTAQKAFQNNVGNINLPALTLESCSNFNSCFLITGTAISNGILNAPSLNMQNAVNCTNFSNGMRMNLATLQAVANTIAQAPATDNTIVLGIDGTLETDPEAQAAVQAIRDKGWDVTAEWNTPAN